MARIHLSIRGRVQGVGFRATVYDYAVGLGLAGWVRNRRDGSVECVAEGPDDAVRALEALCRRGPPGAHVTHVDALEEEPTGEFIAFRVYPTS